jgi:hypothetical protein
MTVIFLNFTVLVRGDHCDYSPLAPKKKLATLLCVCVCVCACYVHKHGL